MRRNCACTADFGAAVRDKGALPGGRLLNGARCGSIACSGRSKQIIHLKKDHAGTKDSTHNTDLAGLNTNLSEAGPEQ
jgi:hypothetical protein